jgi:taurine dioxygenase
MQITPIASALGAEISGLDLSTELTPQQLRAVHAAWLEHLVLLFRDQTLTPAQMIAFSRQFGELERHENYQAELRHPDHPELLVVKASAVDGRRITFGQQWHSDLSYTLRPSMGSCLYCLEIPPVGGDTLFANMYLGYESLSPTMRRLLDGLYAVHDLSNGRSHRDASAEQREATRKRNPPVCQPIVRTHPETGRKALFISEWMCTRIVGMSDEEGRGLLRFLCDQSTREAFTFRQTWRVGDVLMWDNRATVHMALADYPNGTARRLLRTSITGNREGRPLTSATA